MNNGLKKYYEDVYSKDKNSHFLKYRDGRKLSESHEWALTWIDQAISKKGAVIDFGSGEGDFLGALTSWEKRVAIDFSDAALKTSKEKYPELELVKGDDKELNQFKNSVDLVVSFGTLEHVDSPFEIFQKFASCLKDSSSHMIVSCPSFLNIRGVIWITLSKLFDVPMSLSDKHSLSIADFKKFETQDGTVKLIDYKTTDFSVSYGDDLFIDMKKRLTNALRDAELDNSKVDELLKWLYENLEYFPKNQYSGVEATYIFKKI